MSKVHHFGRVHFSRVAAIAVAIALTAVMVAAQSPRNELQRKAETELLALHRDERRAHFQHDIPALLSHLGPHIVDVRDGTVQVLTPDDIGKHFAEYFRNATFSAWDDLQPPTVQVSPDGMQAWMVVRARITYTETDTQGKKTIDDSVMAWMSTYQKERGRWMMTAVTSTTQASETNAQNGK